MESLLKVLSWGGAGYVALLSFMFLIQGANLYFPDTGRYMQFTPNRPGSATRRYG